jgi:hypothetical protein
MKKKWQIIMALVLSLVILLTIAVPAVLAQDEEPSAATIQSGGALAIIAPWTVPAGKEFTVRAFLREDQEPFPNAGIWAINRDDVATLQDELAWLRDNAEPTDEGKDYESVLDAHGMFLGRTGRDGRLAVTFEQAGRYILVAARNGYLPGFTHIGIRDTIKALGIRAPRRAPAGEPVTMQVFERINQKAVEGAGVWAVTRDNVEALKQEAETLRQDTSLSDEDKDYEALTEAYGFFLGRTDENGKLDYTFEDAGVYLLVAVKKGYFPGFTLINVYEQPAALAITATPPRAHVGQEVTLRVADRQSNDPVADAGVWAIGRDDVAALRDEIGALRQDTSTDAAEKDYEAVISACGTFLGRTDERGKLGATFDTAGIYVLVAVKRGYFPGFTMLVVREVITPEKAQPTGRASLEPVVPDNIELK